MTTPVLICDDSSFARKQMARALPSGWDISIEYAANGEEALAAIRAGRGDVLFLDLNMPVMDGYATLQAIREHDLPAMVIVVSGDVQPEAHERVMQLGAMDFIKKPIDSDKVIAILDKYGIRFDAAASGARSVDIEVGSLDIYQEIANVSMGRAADLLARYLGVFVQLPVPKVNMIASGELQQAMDTAANDQEISMISQGFIGAGIAGEALLTFSESSFSDLASLLHYEGEIDESAQVELLMDTTGILIGACLKGMAEQLDINFSQGHPTILGRHTSLDAILQRVLDTRQRMLAIELKYGIEDHEINCDLVLLVSGDSLDRLNERISYLNV